MKITLLHDDYITILDKGDPSGLWYEFLVTQVAMPWMELSDIKENVDDGNSWLSIQFFVFLVIIMGTSQVHNAFNDDNEVVLKNISMQGRAQNTKSIFWEQHGVGLGWSLWSFMKQHLNSLVRS